jgi:hypothetical protein
LIKHKHILVTLVLLAVLFSLAGTARGQTDRHCFPETGYCFEGRIRAFWEQNGGLPVFGYPITDQHEEIIEGNAVQVQWFERNRLELHPENEPPYDVLLGRIGSEVVVASEQPEREEPQEGCLYFEETGFNVCGDILASWQAQGLELDNRPGKTYQESLALFGLPLTGAFETTLSDGQVSTVQWFERARFELHPENAPPNHVLLGRLGVETIGDPTPPAMDAEAIIRAYIGENETTIAEACAEGNFAAGFLVPPDREMRDPIWLIIEKKGDEWVTVMAGSFIDPASLEAQGIPELSCLQP